MPRNHETGAGHGDRFGSDERHRADIRAARRRKAVRYGVPAVVAGAVAATVSLVPAFAGGSPDLPQVSARDLVAKVAGSDVHQLSGTVRLSADLGLPQLPGGAGAFGGAASGSGGSAEPAQKLMELASGTHTLRVAADGPSRQRVSLLEQAAEYSVIHDGDTVWAYDSAGDTVHRSTAKKADTGGDAARGLPHEVQDATPQQLARSFLAQAGPTTSFSVDGTEKVAGRDAYRLVVRPKDSGSTVGAVSIAVDAANGVPLRFTLTPANGGKAVVDASFTSVDFAKPDPATFAFTPPKGAKVVQEDGGSRSGAPRQGGSTGTPHSGGSADGGAPAPTVTGRGWASIAEIRTGEAAGALPSGRGADAGGAAKLLDSLGSEVHGGFGSGHLFSTRLVNALLTDDGTLYVGAVDKQALVKAADAHSK